MSIPSHQLRHPSTFQHALNSLPLNPGISIFGDSISTLRGIIPYGWRCFYQSEAYVEGINQTCDTWWGVVIDALEGHLVTNASFSGSTVEGFGFPAGVSFERLHALKSDTETPDLILMYMGINDFGWGGATNQVIGQSVSASAQLSDLAIDSTFKPTITLSDVASFSDSYALTLTRMHELFPNAMVCCISLVACTHSDYLPEAFIFSPRGVTLSDYNHAIKRAAESSGAYFVDISAFKTMYQSVDGLHPNKQGMRELGSMVAFNLLSTKQTGFCPDYSTLQDQNCNSNNSLSIYTRNILTMTRTTQGCRLSTCEGCKHNALTQNSWSLQCNARRA